MAISIEALGIDRLSIRERLELIEKIWESIPDEMKPDEVPAWHLAELGKRRAEDDASPRAGAPWREALGSTDIQKPDERKAASHTKPTKLTGFFS